MAKDNKDTIDISRDDSFVVTLMNAGLTAVTKSDSFVFVSAKQDGVSVGFDFDMVKKRIILSHEAKSSDGYPVKYEFTVKQLITALIASGKKKKSVSGVDEIEEVLSGNAEARQVAQEKEEKAVKKVTKRRAKRKT